MSSERAVYLETANETEVRQVLRDWQSHYPRAGLLALLPEAESSSVPMLQSLCNELDMRLAGAIFPALLTGDQFLPHGVLLLRFDDMPVSILVPSLAEEEQTVEGIARSVREHLGTSRDHTLFFIFDAMIPNVGTVLERLYLTLADHVHYLGVNAGSESFKPIPCLFDNRQFVQGGVLLLLLKNHKGGLLEHGYHAPDTMISATSTEGNRIIEIDWEPAFDAYRRLMQSQYGVAIDRENFYRYAVHFPFGIIRANGEILVRIPVALEADGSLFCVGEVPPNAILTLLQAPAVDSAHTVATLVEGLNSTYGSLSGQEIVTFYCAGRRLHIGERAQDELADLGRRSGASLVGALSLGEIGSSLQGGYPLFHNGTLVCSPWNGR